VWATGQTTPDLVVLLHLDVEEGLDRATQRAAGHAARDRLESESTEFHQRVATGFSVLAQRNPGRYVVVDATGDVDTVAKRVREVVTAWLEP
jgi:dTMP kinase